MLPRIFPIVDHSLQEPEQEMVYGLRPIERFVHMGGLGVAHLRHHRELLRVSHGSEPWKVAIANEARRKT